MKIRLFLVLLTLCITQASFSQENEFTIKGKVVDEQGSIPLEYATITVTNANDPNDTTGGITGPEGNFSITVPNGSYNIKIEYISFEPYTISNRRIFKDLNLGTIQLAFAASDLDEVTVVAETTTVDVRLDKKIYNIGKDLTTSGGTVSDALNNVPSVSVDVEGAISLRGNENVRILINGKPSAIAGFGSTDALRQLPAESIERVEVITSPSARYDAEGTAGILNIILRKEKTLGLNGSVQANLGYPINSGLSTNINLRTEKFNIFNTTGVRYRDVPGNAFFDNTYFNGTYDRIVEDRSFDRLDRGFNTNLGIEYYLTDRSSITATGFFRLGDDEDVTTNNTNAFNDGVIAQQLIRQEFEGEEDESYQFSLNYINNFNDSGHKLTADFQYENDSETETSLITENQTIPDVSRLPSENILSTEDQEEFLIQADYVLPIGKEGQFEAGYRGNFENEVTDYLLEEEVGLSGEFARNDSLSNVFDYTQNVHALYTQYGNKIGKFNFLLGLRMEATKLKGEVTGEDVDTSSDDELNINFDNDYLGLFPTVNIIYELNEDENVSLGYNRRINRPRGFFVNPFPSRSSEANVFVGNPSLEPAYANAFDLGYLKKWDKMTLTSSIYYQRETNSFERVQENTGQQTPNGVDIIRTIPINLSTNERYGFEAGLLYNPARWLRLNGSVNVFGFKTDGDFNGVSYDAENVSWFGRFSSKVILPGQIDWQTNAFYRGPSQNAQTENEGILSVDLALSKDIMNEQATVGINVSDLFNSRKRRSLTTTDTFISDSEFQWRQRIITATVTYRFNQKKDPRKERGNQNDFDDDGGEFGG